MPLYSVLSPSYETYGGYMTPPEYGCDYEEVHAGSASHAKWAYYNKCKRRSDGYAYDNYMDGRHPLTKISAGLLPPEASLVRPTLCAYDDCNCTERTKK